MPSTYDPLLRLELQATGENATTWGTKTNNNLELVAAAIAGIANITVISGDTSLTTANAATDQARAAILLLTGSPVSAANLIVPPSPKTYAIICNTSGSASITVKHATGTGTSLPLGSSEIVVCTSTTCIGLVGSIESRLTAVSTQVSVIATSLSAINTQLATVSALVSTFNSLDIRIIE
jgi:hypothetical protein